MVKPNNAPEVQVEQALQSIRLRLSKANNYFMDYLVYGGRKDYDAHLEEQIAVDYLREAWLLILTLFENSSQQILLEQAKKDYIAFQKNPFESAMGYDEPYLVWGNKAYELLNIFGDLYIPKTSGRVTTESSVDLLTLIRNMEP